MKLFCIILCFPVFIFSESCSTVRKSGSTTKDTEIKSRVNIKNKIAARSIDTKNIDADELVTYAESLQGIPYKYGSSVKEQGFDCSGFISYVFNHYKIAVPRTSVDFTNAGNEVSMKESRRGDIILFTGSDPAAGIVGHMGIITENNGSQIYFIHSASGGGKGVMISGMSDYFTTRFVKVIRVFKYL